MTAEKEEELELQRWALMERFGPEAVLYRDVKLTLPGGVLTQRAVKGDLITSSSGLVFIPRSEIMSTGPIALLLGFLGPVGQILQMILAWVTERDALTRRRTGAGAHGASAADFAEVHIPYESIQHLESRFGTLYVTVPRGIYGFSGHIPSAADLRQQVAARVGAGHLR